VSRGAEATFPGTKSGRIAYERNIFELYTINPNGSDKTKVTNSCLSPVLGEYSPTGKKITYTGCEGTPDKDLGIYTINVGGGGMYIGYLRRKVDAPGETKLIKTVRGAGYSLREG
jgi:Tol biopolymer transport system component